MSAGSAERPDHRVTRGARFVHARQLDVDWTPGPGQRYADAPHAVMEITHVARGQVWYRPVGADGTAFVVDADRLEAVVGSWL